MPNFRETLYFRFTEVTEEKNREKFHMLFLGVRCLVRVLVDDVCCHGVGQILSARCHKILGMAVVNLRSKR